MIKNNFIKILLILFISSLSVYSQVEKKDLSSIKKSSFNTSENIPFNFDKFDLYRKLYFDNSAIPVNIDSNTVWLWTSIAISNSNNASLQINGNGSVSKILYQQYLEESKFNPVRYILGMAQIGAASYLAYRHIKKYGFAK